MFPILAGNSASTGYNLTRSLRTRASASGYLSRTPASVATDGAKFTWSGWVKRGNLTASYSALFAADAGAGTSQLCYFDANGSIYFITGGTTHKSSPAVFRDPSSWYHAVVVADSTQATAANRLKLYINGTQQTWASVTDPTLNVIWDINKQSRLQGISFGTGSNLSSYFDGYLAEINLIDGQALTPSSFGSTNAATGVWQPARYAGTYGTNGFYLPFTDNSALTTSSNVGLGKDFSGNGNYWTTNNISLTSGVTYDSMTDVPTLTSATASNFAVLNPLDKSAAMTLSNGNLTMNYTAGGETRVRGTIQIPSTGKWYYDFTCGSTFAGYVGIASASAPLDSTGAQSYGWNETGRFYVNGSYSTTPFPSFTTGDVLGVAVDTTANTILFYKNGVAVSAGAQSISSSFTYFPFALLANGTYNANFGQRPFTFSPPTGFLSLNTFNLPDSTIVKGNTVMDATLYTGNGSTQTITNAAGFKPDLVWTKGRSNSSTNHLLTNSVAGNGKSLTSNTTGAEGTRGSTITSTGFNYTYPNEGGDGNVSGQTYVGWQWQAGQGTTSSNTSGTITSTVSVNASAGFSVVTYTGTGANATVGHGLGVSPQMIIFKLRNGTGSPDGWGVYHVSIGNTYVLLLDSTSAQQGPSSNYFNATTPSSSVMSLGNWSRVNNSGGNYVAYCWTPIAGYSAFGSISTNSSADNGFAYTGFLSRFIMLKRTDAASNWIIWDTARNTFNVLGNDLYPNLSNAEASTVSLDIVSNGFKLRSSGFAGTWIYAAFATTPFKNSLGF